MKIVLSLALALIMVLSCISLVACGDDKENGAPPPSDGGEARPPSIVTWEDIPLYPGAEQAQKGSWAIPPEQGEWSNVEWRYYETGASTDEVASFYKSQMPGNGWEEMMWMEAQGVAWAYYTKNGEENGAMFWVSSDEGKTFFALMRASQ